MTPEMIPRHKEWLVAFDDTPVDEPTRWMPLPAPPSDGDQR